MQFFNLNTNDDSTDSLLENSTNTRWQRGCEVIIEQSPDNYKFLLWAVPGSGKTRASINLAESIRIKNGACRLGGIPHILFISFSGSVAYNEYEKNSLHGVAKLFEENSEINKNEKQDKDKLPSYLKTMGYKKLHNSMYRIDPNTAENRDKDSFYDKIDDESDDESTYKGSSTKNNEDIDDDSIDESDTESIDKPINELDDESNDKEEGSKNEDNELQFDKAFVDRIRDDHIIILDESHQLYSADKLNTYGKAVMTLIKECPNTYFIFITATPLITKPTEIGPFVSLFVGEEYHNYDFLAEKPKKNKSNTKDVNKSLINKKAIPILERLGQYIIALESPSIANYPQIIFEGNPHNILLNQSNSPLHYIWCMPSIVQHDAMAHHMNNTNTSLKNDANLIRGYEHISWPINMEFKNFNNITKKDLMKAYPTIDVLVDHSAYLRTIYDIFFNQGLLFEPGNIVIYSQNIIFPGHVALSYFLSILGFRKVILSGESDEDNYGNPANPLCLTCKGIHNSSSKHDPLWARFIVYNSEISNVHSTELRENYNSPKNIDGSYAKILIGSDSITVSLALYNTNKLIIYMQPYSHTYLLQLIGRFMRPNMFTSNNIEAIIRVFSLLFTGYTENLGTQAISREILKNSRHRTIQALLTPVFENAHMANTINPNAASECFIDGPIRYKPKLLLKVDLPKRSKPSDIHDYLQTIDVKNVNLKSITWGPIIRTTNSKKIRVNIAKTYIKLLLKKHNEIYLSTLLKYYDSDINIDMYSPSAFEKEDLYIAIAEITWDGNKSIPSEIIDKMKSLRKSDNYKFVLNQDANIIEHDVCPGVMFDVYGNICTIVLEKDILSIKSIDNKDTPSNISLYIDRDDYMGPLCIQIPEYNKIESSDLYKIKDTITKLYNVWHNNPLMILYLHAITVPEIEIFVLAVLKGTISHDDPDPALKWFYNILIMINYIVSIEYLPELIQNQLDKDSFGVGLINNAYKGLSNGKIIETPYFPHYIEDNNVYNVKIFIKIVSKKGLIFKVLKHDPKHVQTFDRRTVQSGDDLSIKPPDYMKDLIKHLHRNFEKPPEPYLGTHSNVNTLSLNVLYIIWLMLKQKKDKWLIIPIHPNHKPPN